MKNEKTKSQSTNKKLNTYLKLLFVTIVIIMFYFMLSK